VVSARDALPAQVTTVTQLRAKLKAETSADPALLRLSADDGDPAHAMTIANTFVIPLVAYLGALVDRVGPKRVIQLGNAGAAVAFVLYPFAHSLVAVTVLVFVASLTRTAFWSALGPMITQITEQGERELWFGFLQAMRNAGFGVGGVLAAVALTIGSDAAYQSVVLGNAASYVAAFVLMLGVAGGARVAAAQADRSSPWVAFGDRSSYWPKKRSSSAWSPATSPTRLENRAFAVPTRPE